MRPVLAIVCLAVGCAHVPADSTRSEFEAALELLEEGEFEAAHASFMKLTTASSPEVARMALNNAAVCLESLGRYGEARALYERLAQQSPQPCEALFRVGINAEKSFAYDDSLTAYRRVVVEHPSCDKAALAQFNLARLLEALTRFDEAIVEWEHHAALFPYGEDAPMSVLRAEHLRATHRPDWPLAISNLTRFLDRNRNDPMTPHETVMAWQALALSYRSMGRRMDERFALQSAVATFENLKFDVDSSSAATVAAATSQFELAELLSADLEQLELQGSAEVLQRALDRREEALASALQAYDRVLKMNHVETTVGALTRGATLHIDLARGLHLFERANPLLLLRAALHEGQAKERLERALLLAKENGLQGPWPERARMLLNQLQPGARLISQPLSAFVSGLDLAPSSAVKVEQARKLLQREPSNVSAMRTVAAALSVDGKPELAREVLTEAAARQPNDSATQTALGLVLLDLDRRERAGFAFRLAATLDPNSANARNNAGAMFIEAGALDDALFELEAAVRLKPDLAASHLNLGNLAHARGQRSRALEHYRRAASLPASSFNQAITLLEGPLPDLSNAERCRQARQHLHDYRRRGGRDNRVEALERQATLCAIPP